MPSVRGGVALVPIDEGDAARRTWFRVRAALSVARSLWRDFTGESAYERYVERHRREYPDHPPMNAKEFWRARADFDEDNVSTGCC